jgi:hypothetical protein
MHSDSGYYDMQSIQEISSIFEHLRYIEDRIDRLSGVNKNRQGDISPQAGLGTTSQAVEYSSTQTESLANLHEEFKLECIRRFVGQAKHTLRDKKGSQQYMLDDQEIAFLEFDGAIFNDADYDIQIVSSTKVQEFKRALKTDIASRLLQSQDMKGSDVLELLLNDENPNSAIAKIKVSEKRRVKEQQELEKQRNAIQQQQLELQKELQKMKLESDLQLLNAKYDREEQKLRLQAELGFQSNLADKYMNDDNANGIEDQIELDKLRIQNEDNDKQRQFEARENEKDRLNKIEIARLSAQRSKTNK